MRFFSFLHLSINVVVVVVVIVLVVLVVVVVVVICGFSEATELRGSFFRSYQLGDPRNKG